MVLVLRDENKRMTRWPMKPELPVTMTVGDGRWRERSWVAEWLLIRCEFMDGLSLD